MVSYSQENKMIEQRGGFQCMRTDKEIFQCSCCGTIHKVNEKYKPRGDIIYVPLWCDKCNEYTQQLHCGDDDNEIYALYDLNKDSRYY